MANLWTDALRFEECVFLMTPKLCILNNLVVFEKYLLSLLSLCFWTFGKGTLKSLFMILGLFLYIYTYICIYTHIYIQRDRERENRTAKFEPSNATSLLIWVRVSCNQVCTRPDICPQCRSVNQSTKQNWRYRSCRVLISTIGSLSDLQQWGQGPH